MIDQTTVERFAAFIGRPDSEARRILEQESLDKTAHGGRDITSGYDYDRQRWCECSHCRRAV